MLAFLALLPRGLVTFLYALAAFLRFFIPSVATHDAPISAGILGSSSPLLGWSITSFVLASASLLVDLGLEWHRRNRRRNSENASRDRQAERRERALLRLDGEIEYRRAFAEVLLDPSDGSRQRLRELISVEI